VLTVAPGEADPAELARDRGARGGPRAAASGWARPRARSWRISPSGGHGPRLRRRHRATMRVVDDPVGPTMRRWADALADLGVGEGDLSDGVGLRLRTRPGKLHASVMNGAGARGAPC
jgi:hypothetical protein